MKQHAGVLQYPVRLVFLAVAALGAGQATLAAPRAAPPVPEVVQSETPSTADWLQRLPGRYLVGGAIHHIEKADFDPRYDFLDGEPAGPAQYLNEWSQPIEGKFDCIAFADAPGLQCVINVEWPEMWNILTGRASFGAVSDLTPAMVLAGVTPADQPVRFLLVDKRGLGHPGSLMLKGETAVAKVPCVNLPGVLACNQKFTIEARSTSNLIFVTLTSEVRYLRSKLDRKLMLVEPTDPMIKGQLERRDEWVEELLQVTFSLKRGEFPTVTAR